MQIAKPLPLDDSDAAPYWEAAVEHRLAMMRCAECELYVHPPGPRCSQCGGSDRLDWVSFGHEVYGTVYSYVTVYRAVLRSFVDDIPYVVALCDVDGAPGVHLAANLFGADVSEVRIGSRVKMFWEDRSAGHSLPQWQLIAQTAGTGQ